MKWTIVGNFCRRLRIRMEQVSFLPFSNKCLLLFVMVSTVYGCRHTIQKGNMTDDQLLNDTVSAGMIKKYIDTLDGKYVIKIKREDALKMGISTRTYDRYMEDMEPVNCFIDSIREKFPHASIEYHLLKESG